MLKMLFLIWIFMPLRAFALDTYYIIPDKFEIQINSGMPMFSISQTGDGYKASMVFQSSYKDTEEALFRRYAEKLDQLEIIKLMVDPDEFSFLSRAIENKIMVKELKKYFFPGSIKVEMSVGSTLPKEQFMQLLRFNVVFGNAQGKVACTSATLYSYSFCSKRIKNLPVVNQYRYAEQQGNQKLASDFAMLNQYKNQIFLGHALTIFSKVEIDNFAYNDLTRNSQCSLELDEYKHTICDIIGLYSKEYSLVKAIENTGKQLFADSGIGEQDFSNYIFNVDDVRVPEPVPAKKPPSNPPITIPIIPDEFDPSDVPKCRTGPRKIGRK